MKDLRHIFETFSKRNPEPTKGPADKIPDTTRNRVLYWCSELFGGLRPSEFISRENHAAEFWQEEYRRLLYRTGKLALTPEDAGHDPRQAVAYALTCSGREFLDFLEDIFNNEAFFQVNSGDKNIVDELNELLRQDNLPYSITYFVWEDVQIMEGHFMGHTGRQVRNYPKVISKETEILHNEAMQPALQLLAAPYFASANREFLAALEDYRKGDIGDCLVKCASAFESVLKVICCNGSQYLPA
jgi:hypothetical protein